MGGVSRWLLSGLLLVDAALGLAGPGPPPAARVLARCDPLGAGPAADGRVAVVLEGVAEDAVLSDVALDLLVAPAGERGDLDLLLLLVPPNDRGDHAVMRLGPAEAGRPRVVPGERVPQRRHLAQRAAQVGVAAVEVRAVHGVLLGH